MATPPVPTAARRPPASAAAAAKDARHGVDDPVDEAALRVDKLLDRPLPPSLAFEHAHIEK